jgi:hypothetical protein
MTDPHNPAAQNPSGGDAAPATPPAPPAYGEYATPPAAPAYGEYAPTAPAGPPAPDANAYQQPAYAQAPAYAPERLRREPPSPARPSGSSRSCCRSLCS